MALPWRPVARDYALDILRLNQSRVLAGTGSPKVLVGGINLNSTPNFHTISMIEMGASIVAITLEREHAWRPDMLFVPPNRSLISSMTALPQKWDPDFFWDAQAEHGHYVPPGLSMVPIPSVVSFIHAHLGHALRHMRGMFDCMIAPTEFMRHLGDAVLPWGASWGSQKVRIEAVAGKADGGPRDIDFLCTLNRNFIGHKSTRGEAVAAVEALKAKRTDLNIQLVSGLKPIDYYKTLRRAKAALSMGTWGQPMSYRPLEIIDCGAVMVHVDETGYGSKASMAEFLTPGVHYVEATPEALEQAVDIALSPASAEMPGLAFRKVEKDYSYRKQYERLFELAGRTKPGKRMSEQDFSRNAFAVSYTTGFKEYASAHTWALTEADKATMRSLPRSFERPNVCLWTPSNVEQLSRFRTDLSRADEPVEEIYRRHFEEAKCPAV